MNMVTILFWCSLLATTFAEEDKIPEAGRDKNRYLLHCSAEDSFVLQVFVTYQIGAFSEGSLERTGKNPGAYQTEFLIPWSKLSYEVSDSKAKISATLTWRDQSAQGRAGGS